MMINQDPTEKNKAGTGTASDIRKSEITCNP